MYQDKDATKEDIYTFSLGWGLLRQPGVLPKLSACGKQVSRILKYCPEKHSLSGWQFGHHSLHISGGHYILDSICSCIDPKIIIVDIRQEIA